VMRKLYLRDLLLFSISTALLLGWLITSSGFARNSYNPNQTISLLDEGRTTSTLGNFPKNTITPTPDATNVISIPILQHDASLQTSEPQASGELTPPPSITPTPIPPQSTEDNAPIVFGAIVIVLIIILAWFIFGRRIFEKKY